MIAAAVEVGQQLVVESHEMQDRRVQIVDVDSAFDCRVAKLVG